MVSKKFVSSPQKPPVSKANAITSPRQDGETPVLTDEILLNIDGFVPVDPAAGMRQDAERFLASRQWFTRQIFYGDQSEPDEDGMEDPMWSMTFCLGLDHIKTTDNWFSDVEALLSFAQTVHSKLNNEFVVEVRYRSKLWHSEHIAFVGEDMNVLKIREMIERVA